MDQAIIYIFLYNEKDGGGGGNGGVSVDELWRRCNAFNRYNNPSEKASKQAITETIRSHWFHSFVWLHLSETHSNTINIES